MSDTSGRFRLFTLWIFLTIAAVGLALIAASLSLQVPGLLTLGTAVLGTGGFCFLVVQFWVTGTRPLAAAPVGGRQIDFTYSDPVPVAVPGKKVEEAVSQGGRHHAQAPRFEEDLVEFELAPSEAPTKLNLPPAFQVEAQADAEPVSNQPWLEQTLTVGSGSERDFVPAVERRKEIVSGLPLLSQIFSEPAQPRPEPSAERNGKSRGQCGSCGTFLWAPTQRPIRLRCPKCGHVKTLTE